MNFNPDWARVGVVSPDHQLSALGDATRWGAQLLQHLPGSPNIATFPGQVLSNEQVLTVACRDQYPRAWTLSGTLNVPESMWALPDGIGPGMFLSALAVTVGLGQTSFVQVFNVRAIVNADAPFYFPSEYAGITSAGSLAPLNTRPYVIPGAIIGKTVQVRVINSFFFPLGPGPFDPVDFITEIMLTPFSPGVEAPL